MQTQAYQSSIPGIYRSKGRPERFERIVRAVSDRDREWFDAHPDADSYVRPYVPGEFWPNEADPDATVIVTCYRDPIDGHQLARIRHCPSPDEAGSEGGRR